MIGSYLIDDITIKTTTLDKWNVATYKDTDIKARVEYKTRLVRDQAGKQVVSSARIYLRNRTITHKELINFDDIDHAILAIGKAKDFGVGYIFLDVV